MNTQQAQQAPEDLTGAIMQVGDFCIYTLNQYGGLNFGYIEEIKVANSLRIKIKETDRFGTVQKETVWDTNTHARVDTEKDSTTWLNYTYPSRFLITQPF